MAEHCWAICPQEATLGVRADSPQMSCARQIPLLEPKGKEVASALSVNGWNIKK